MFDPVLDSDAVLAQFNRLIQELLRGSIARNCFRPWEVALLLDIEGCNLKDATKRETLRRYQRAVQKQMEKGANEPMKLSQYLGAQRGRKLAVPAAQTDSESLERLKQRVECESENLISAGQTHRLPDRAF